jgi:uncharacterized membrane protein
MLLGDMSRKLSKWIAAELPTLVNEGVIDDASAERIKAYYAKKDGSERSWALTVFGLLGGLLIGLGVVLLLAHNWDHLSRGTRTFIAYVPLVVAQTLAAIALLKREAWANRREGIAMFWCFTTAAVIAMVAQIYHMPGDAGAFVLTWMLLSLPIIYLMNSVSVSLVYLYGITQWAGAMAAPGLLDTTAMWFWPLWLAVMPIVIASFRANPSSSRTALLMWAVCLAATAGLVITLMDLLDAWWLILFGTFFAALYLADKRIVGNSASDWKRPGYLIGGVGAVAIAFFCTFELPVETWIFYGRFDEPLAPGFILQLGVAAILLLGFAKLLGWALRSRNSNALWIGVIPLLVMGRQAIAATVESGALATIIFNVFLFALGLAKLVQGFKTQNVGRANAGLVILFALIIVRFFDADIGFILKGIVFVLLGAAFLAANIMLARRRKEAV